ncbi:MAG: Ig-like domain-containing protein, partial [Clostridia bacterium]|nr:Ig-like domain-containing protein [Clostridia bacterium]
MRKILWLLFACAAMLVAASGCAEDGQILLLNDRAAIPAGQTLVFSFSPTANNLYDLATFGGETHGILELDGETLFDTEGFSQRARLIAGEVYKLTVTAKEEDAVLEIMRASLGRCYNEPVQITDFAAGYDKVIARAYDTHWYRFVAPADGYYAFRTVSDIDTVGYLLDERGSEIAQNDDLKAPYSLDFRIETALKQGETCYLRISAHDGETGAYHLTIRILEKENLPVEEIAFSDRSMELRAGESASVHLDGDPTKNDPVFMTLDSSIAVINESGVISAVSAGATTVFIAGLNGTGDRMRVFVEPAPVEAIVPDAEIIDLHPGQSENLAFQVLPREAGDAELIYLSSDLSVVSVDMDGQVTALKEGVADVTILSGEVSAAVRVRVLPAPPVYRALLVGEQGYAGSDLRLGAVNTTQGIYDLLSQQDYDSGSYRTTMRIDLSAKELILAIRSAFSDCAPSDISLFYINCHGELRDGRPVLKMHDGSVVTVRALY